MYGAVEAQSNDDVGAYLADYAVNSATLGAYGTVKAFNDGQVASGIVGVVAFATAAYGAYQSISSLLVSGNEKLGNPLPPDGRGETLFAANGSGETLTDTQAPPPPGWTYEQAAAIPRLPDFYAINVNVTIPTPWTGTALPV